MKLKLIEYPGKSQYKKKEQEDLPCEKYFESLNSCCKCFMTAGIATLILVTLWALMLGAMALFGTFSNDQDWEDEMERYDVNQMGNHFHLAYPGGMRTREQKKHLTPYGDSHDEGRQSFIDSQMKTTYWSEMIKVLPTFALSRDLESETINDSLKEKYFGRVNAYRKLCHQSSHRSVNRFHSLTFTIEEVGVCDSEVVDVLIIIPSRISHFQNRQLIRQSYGSMNNILGKTIRLIFALGESSSNQTSEFIKNESLLYRDIIQGNFKEDWRNVILNLNLALWWTGYHCPQARYVVKVDDDTFLNIGHLTQLLPQLPSGKLLYCKITSKRSPRRSRKSHPKWYVSYSEYPQEKFPDYCSGYGYLLSVDVAAMLLGCSLESKSILPLDDVFYTGILRKQIDLQLFGMWDGHGATWISPSMADFPAMADYIFLGSENNLIQVGLWKKMWKNAILSVYSDYEAFKF